MIRLDSPYLQFSIDQRWNGWSVYARSGDNLGLEWAQTEATYLHSGLPWKALGRWSEAQVEDLGIQASHHGPLRQLQLIFPRDEHGLQARLEFALPQHLPALLWRLHLHNEGAHPASVGRLTMLDVDSANLAALGARALHRPDQPKVLGISSSTARIFSNGWQSWNHTGAYGHGERYRRTRLRFFSEPMRVSQGVPHPHLPGYFTSDFFGVIAPGHGLQGWLAGFLSQQQQFGSLDIRLIGAQPALTLWANGDHAHLDPGQETRSDWACLFLLDLVSLDPLEPYLEAVGRENGIGLSGVQGQVSEPARHAAAPSNCCWSEQKLDIRSGWSSWYYYYRRLTAQAVRRNLAFAAKQRHSLPLDLIQIDDGYMTYAGDWDEFMPGFPGGVAPLAQEIRQAGFVPGLWMAPFIVDRRSRLARQHPEWLVHGWLNRPVNAGFLHGRLATGLDLTHPGALEFIHQLIETAVQRWGFPFLKLDFLYAGGLPGRRHDPTRTRAQAMRLGLETMRMAAGDETFLLGCGCPLGPAVGLMDGMRISADVDIDWYPTFTRRGRFLRPEPDIPSARNAIQNSLTRAALHGRWWRNDPDCLLVRRNTHLTHEETRSLASVIALSGGLWMSSDDLPGLGLEQLRLLQAMLPPLSDHRPLVLDWLDASTPARLRQDLDGPTGSWHLLARFNWSERPRTMTIRPVDYRLPPGYYWGRSFWSGQVQAMGNGGWEFPDVPPHGCILVAVRQQTPGTPQYLGSDLHISQGNEVIAWDWETESNQLELRLQRSGPVEGVIDLALPYEPQTAGLSGRSNPWQTVQPGVYRFPVTFDSLGVLNIAW